MTASTTANQNGRARRSLANEIDRLDKTLDGLAEGLNEAVADAVKSAVSNSVRDTVQIVLTELFTNPEILDKLRTVLLVSQPATVAPTAKTTSSTMLRERLHGLWLRVRACVRKIREFCGRQVRRIGNGFCHVVTGALRLLTTMRSHSQILKPFRNQILIATAIGLLVGVGAWFAGPWVAGIASGMGGFLTALSVQAGLWFRRMFRESFAAIV
jgi:hypothetical protein